MSSGYGEIIIDSYSTIGLTEEDEKIYEVCKKFLKKDHSQNSLEKLGFTVLHKENNYTILHYDEGVTLIINIIDGSKGLELKSAGRDVDKVRHASKTLLGIIGLELKGKKISLRSNSNPKH